MLLHGQVAVVTGSSRGIGRAIALQMAHEGALVVVNGLTRERVDAVVDEILEQGGKAIGICELVVQGGAAIIARTIDTFGKLDILINNAGVVRDKISYRLTQADWDEVINVHLNGAFSCTKPALLHMRDRKEGGSIINMTSTAGLHGTIGQLNYSAAKAGILGMTWTLALELKKDNISVNAVAPAALTDMTRPHVERAAREAAQKGEQLSDYWKIGAAEDVANLIVALAAPSGRKITGRIFSVNGGRIGLWEQPSHRVLADRADESWSPEELLDQVLPVFMEP